MDSTPKIVSLTDLKDAIQHLKVKHKLEGKELKEQFEMAYESIKPVNLLKSTLKDIVSSKEIKGDIVNSSIGLAVGTLSKLLFVRSSRNPLRKLVGSIIMLGVSNLVSKNPGPVKKLGQNVLKMIKKKTNQSADLRFLE
jgi:hypothetical protein